MEEKKIKDVVCVLNPDEIYRLQHYCGVDVSSLVTPYDMESLRREGVVMPTIHENQIYSLHPYKRKYIEFSEKSEDEIVLERINRLETIVSYLGGKDMRVLSTSLQLNDKSRLVEGAVSGSHPVTNGEISGSYQSKQMVSDENSVQSHAHWPGYYTLEGYQKALELAKQYKLDTDCTVESLLLQRGPEHPSAIEEKEYRVDVRGDLEQKKNIAVDLKANLKNVGTEVALSGAFKTESKTSRHNTFDFAVSFGELKLQEIQKPIKENQKQKNSKTTILIVVAVVVIGILLAVLL